jgi:uncharacterized membrane protein YhaH (DUF805 family)
MVDIQGHMMFADTMKYTRKDWWLGGIALGVINMVMGMVVAMAGISALAMIASIAVGWASLGLWVGRLRDRGHSSAGAFALRIILAPWGFVECAFLAGAEE